MKHSQTIYVVIRTTADDLSFTDSSVCSTMKEAKDMVRHEMKEMKRVLPEELGCKSSDIERSETKAFSRRIYNLYYNEANSYYWFIQKHTIK